MTNEAFIQLKDFILSKNRYFNTGFANVHYDGITGRIISDKINVEIIQGISDKLGNYFYIRTESGYSYSYSRNQISGCKNSHDVFVSGTLVAIVKQGIAKNLNFNLVNTLLLYRGDGDVVIQPVKSEIFADAVVNKEYRGLEIEDREHILQRVYLEKMSLVALDFKFATTIHPVDQPCFKNPWMLINALL